MVQNAKAAIKGISNSTFNLRASKILTGFCALMIPVGEADGTEGPSIWHFCNLFGLGRQSKYVKSAISNHIAFNIYLEKDGKLEIGKRASCAGSDDATIITFGDDGSITTQLHLFETVKKYKNLMAVPRSFIGNHLWMNTAVMRDLTARPSITSVSS